jgi:alpha-galactosidase
MTTAPLSTANPCITRQLGAMTVGYTRNPTSGIVEFSFWPTDATMRRVEKRQNLDAPEVKRLPAIYLPLPAHSSDPLVQVLVRGCTLPGAFAQGRTLRNNTSCFALRFTNQSITEDDQGVTITTSLAADAGFAADHVLRWENSAGFFRVHTVFHNRSAAPLTLDLLASFSFTGVSPFAAGDAPGRLRLHRLRSCWSAEGRMESRSIEEIHLERSWSGHGVFCERFGQLGSLPVRGFFPFVAVEDTAAGVLWGAQLELASSWQLEVYRQGDDLAISGGLADREFGHWSKTIAPGASFTSPSAVLSTVAGDLEDLQHHLTLSQDAAARMQPESEEELPVVFNDWCASWGNPSHQSIVAIAGRVAPLGIKYLVIDDGWAERPGESFQQNGDWNINREAFPNGLKATCKAVRALGLIPGIWFEFEVCNEGSQAWLKTEHHLKRDGQVLQVGNRRFWDFRDPWTFEYLTKKVIQLLRDNDFGYLRVDYNETIGLGCDGAESPGEALRQHIAGVQEFFREIRRQLPNVVIENCASGGHRLEPSMMALCSMGSFSDAHETVEIPIIAAKLHGAILPRQSQVWAVLRASDTPQRCAYSLAATFLGRMTISGDLAELPSAQLEMLADATAFYRQIVPIIKHGQSRRFGSCGASFRHPTGWQALRRVSTDGSRILCVIHTFADPPQTPLLVPLPPGAWKISSSFQCPAGVRTSADQLFIPQQSAFTGFAVLLEPLHLS